MRLIFPGVFLLWAVFWSPTAATPPAPPDVGISAAQFWSPAFGTPPRLPMAGDANGDGRADLLSFWPEGDGVVDLALTSYFGKPVAGNQARTHFGNTGIAAACGAFARAGRAADVCAVFADGSIRVASDMAVGSRSYAKDEGAGTIPLALLPKPPVRSVVADFDADTKPDVLLIGSDNKLLLLLNRRTTEGTLRMVPVPIDARIGNVRQVSAGQFGENQPAQLVWLDDRGGLLRAGIKIGDSTGTLNPPQLLLHTSPEAKMVVGRFCGAKTADIVIGQQLLPGGVAAAPPLVMPNLPTVDEAKSDAPWIAADFDNNGRDDIVRFRRDNGQRFGGEDTLVHFVYGLHDTEKGYVCSANDGLLDAWKTGKIKPGGLDLAAMGCRVGRRDIIVELERFDNVSLPALRANMERVQRFYAALPIQNPDGSTGITLHVLYQKPTPVGEHDVVMREFDHRFPPPDHRGVVHTMFAENDGPLVSKINGDNGHFNGGAAEFIHEFGHQLGLTHEGFHQAEYSAAYPSVMNYGYSYGVNGRSEAIRYSSGVLADVFLDEQHLSEVLPHPLEQVDYLSGPPYNFRLRSAPGGKATFIDWNWNGVFGEPDVQADINYSHGVSIGPRYDGGRAQTAPVLIAHGAEPGPQRLLMFYGQAASGRSGSLSPTSPGQLVLRVWQGTSRDKDAQNWSPETTVEQRGVTGDASAAYLGDSLGGATWAAYPTSSGTMLRAVRFEKSGAPSIGPTLLVPNSYGTDPTLTTVGSRLGLMLWRGPLLPVGFRFIDVAANGQPVVQPEIRLGFRSAVPVGAAAAGAAAITIGRIANEGEANAGRTEIMRFVSGSNGLQDAGRQWVDGVYSTHRMTLLWRPEVGFGEGRVIHLSGGVTSADKPWAEQYFTQQVAYSEIGNGWQWRKYYQNDYASVSAPGACWFQNNIVYALRLYSTNPARSDVISFGFYGTGASPETQGDFDDIGYLRDFGLSRSLPIMLR